MSATVATTASARRLLVAGLIAGVVLNSGEFILNGVLLARDWDALMASMHRTPVGAGDIATLATMTFVLGMSVVWIYSLVATRLTRGPRTAALVGAAVCVLAYAFGLGWVLALGLISPRIYWVTVLWGLVEIPVAALIGAWYLDRRWVPPDARRTRTDRNSFGPERRQM